MSGRQFPLKCDNGIRVVEKSVDCLLVVLIVFSRQVVYKTFERRAQRAVGVEHVECFSVVDFRCHVYFQPSAGRGGAVGRSDGFGECFGYALFYGRLVVQFKVVVPCKVRFVSK